MSSAAESVRRFNRYYTQRIGVLSDRYLGQLRPLAEARLLFELGDGERPVSDLRIHLGLDSGYLSRLLRSLESQQLVAVATAAGDRRARVAALTRKGHREVRRLNDRSTSAAAELLEPLSTIDRERLLAAMRDIQRILRKADITIAEVDPASPDAQRCLLAYAAELNERFPEGFTSSDLANPADIGNGAGACLVARQAHEVLACGVLRAIDPDVGEIKHLWVAPDARGLGLSRRMMTELERIAASRAMTTVRLDTHSALTEAIGLYRKSGYREIPAYGANPHAHIWFEKHLADRDGNGVSDGD